MRTFVIAVATLAVIAAAVGIYLTGLAAGEARGRRWQLHRIGLTAASADRYLAAIRLCERLEGVTDTAGVLAGDALSAETQRQAAAILEAHRTDQRKMQRKTADRTTSKGTTLP